MKKIFIGLCLSGVLVGCSSKPGNSDISAGVSAYWGKCAKISDVTKNNGVDKGSSYQVSYTYKMELLEDGAGMLGTPPSCSSPGQVASLIKIMVSGGHEGSLVKGDVFTVSNESTMIKSEQGWVFQ
jgi:hypothetical protein